MRKNALWHVRRLLDHTEGGLRVKNLGLGLQLYSVRKMLAYNEAVAVRAVAQMGYREVELCAPNYENGRFASDLTPVQTRELYAGLGLRLLSIAMAVDLYPDLEQWRRLVEYSVQIGCEGVCCSVATFANREAVLRRADFFNAVARFAAKHGQKFFYHNHYHEFQHFQGETALDLLVENTDPALVDFELDTFWALRGGADPLACMDRLGERLKLIHQKDLSAKVRPVNLFEKIPEGTVIDWKAFGKYANEPEAFRELGRGTMDVPAILEKARSMPSVYSVIVEQDHSTIGELESAQINYAYLRDRL